MKKPVFGSLPGFGKAPPGDTGGGRYQLTCTVDDRRGGVTTGQFGVSGIVETIGDQRIAFTATLPDGFVGICVMNADGTELRNLSSRQFRSMRPSWSPDGSRLVYMQEHPASTPGFPRAEAVHLMTVDGDSEQLFHASDFNWAYIRHLKWTGDGTALIALAKNVGGTTDLFRIPLTQPLTPQVIAVNPGIGGQPHWMDVNPVDDSVIFSDLGDFQHLGPPHLDR